jgi:hypothetical protein
MKTLLIIGLSLLLCVTTSFADETTQKKLGIESLSPELRDLLKKEMYALQEGMMSIIPAYISGNWEEIETISLKMKNSYILKQNITKKQIQELHSSLPSEFIKKDKEFHYLSGMLNHAAKNKKSELIGFYYSKLSESCLSCHSQYATHRFPSFNMDQETKSEHAH